MLTDTAARNAKPKDKPFKISDSGGLYLLVKTTGKYWRMDYRFGGKRKTLAIGVYPTIILVNARKKRDEAKKLLAEDIDPAIVKAINKQNNTQQKIPSKPLPLNGTQKPQQLGQHRRRTMSCAILKKIFFLGWIIALSKIVVVK